MINSGLPQDVPSGVSRVTVVDVDMPFWSMVNFMFKWALATIPAILMLAFVGAVLVVLLGGLLGLR